jgi:predicted nucleic acid-binding protein
MWAYWFDPQKYPKQHAKIKRRLEEVAAAAKIGISVITWGESAVELQGNNKQETSDQAEHLHFIKTKKPWIVDIRTYTAEEYGKLRGLLCTNVLKRKKGLRTEELVDRFTWLELGSLENDLWIAAQAITHNLTLVTNDEKLNRIRDVAGNDLHIENWTI